MSTYLFLTLGDRTVMVAKPATYQDLKREVRKQFPMLASVFSVLVLFKPILEDGTMLDNWVEVDASAYGAVHNCAQVIINVAEPITKRYMFPFPDGRNSNVGPANQVPQMDALGKDNIPIDGQVSTKNSKPSRSKYIYPNSDASPNPERSDGAACASGWAGASERFRRSAKLIPNLKDCKEAVGLEVGESNCYPDEEEEADNNRGHFQEEEPSPGLTEKGWYTGTEDIPHKGKQTANAPLANYATTKTAGGANVNTAGKSNPNTNVKNMRYPSPYHTQPSRHSGVPTGASNPEEDRPVHGFSHRWGPRVRDRYNITPPIKSDWGSDDDRQDEAKGSPFGPSDYVYNSPYASPRNPFVQGWNGPCGNPRSPPDQVPHSGCGWACCAERKGEDNADQKHAHTAYAHDNSYEAAPSVPTALAALAYLAAPNGDRASNQVSQNALNLAHDHGASDWSPPRRRYSGLYRWPREPQQPHPNTKTAHQPVPHYSPPTFSAPPHGSLSTAADPGRYTTGSPVAKFRRSSHLAHGGTAGQKGQTWANAGTNFQAHVEGDDKDQQRNLSGYQDGHLSDGSNAGFVRVQDESKNTQTQGDDVEDFWYAPIDEATRTAWGGGSFKRDSDVYDKKRNTDESRQANQGGWRKVSNSGWGETLRPGEW
ncbi:hypothetical protein VMCG_08740 [Cytospora schulzeri]|uniref:Uncharacterized protein n=1 Tax=Cytospora schulzeri TaxID=448051 RepID=A0A423VQ54_9PEZI|nr:hypothetical protein VMCG_08740 [Valsa malicola]